MNTDKIFMSGCRPLTNGLVEKFNGALAQSLSMYASGNQKDWDEHLISVLFAYRVSPSEVTCESPFYMLYGREPLLFINTALLPPREMSPARRRAQNSGSRTRGEGAEHRGRNYTKGHDLHAVPLLFSLGDKVWVCTPKNRKGLSKKLAYNYHGPYRIVEFFSPINCVLREMDNRCVSTTVHVARMKRYVDPAFHPIRQPPDVKDEPYLLNSDLPEHSLVSAHVPSADAPDSGELDDDADQPNDVYTAEGFVKQRLRNGQPEYLIKWLGFPARHNT